jgi:hypothetical protein
MYSTNPFRFERNYLFDGAAVELSDIPVERDMDGQTLQDSETLIFRGTDQVQGISAVTS